MQITGIGVIAKARIQVRQQQLGGSFMANTVVEDVLFTGLVATFAKVTMGLELILQMLLLKVLTTIATMMKVIIMD